MIVSTKAKIYVGIGILLVLVSLSFSTCYFYKLYVENKEKVERVEKINNNNFLASLDSLRKVSKDQWERLGYVYDLQSQTSKYLREELVKQGYKLTSLQEVSLKISDIIVTLKGGTTEVDSMWATYVMPKYDSLMVSVSGKTSINLKNKDLSFTKLILGFKPIPLQLKISKNESGQIIGNAESLMPGVEITNLKTTVDENIYVPKPCEEQKFLDLLKIGALIGSNKFKSSEFNLGKIVFGFTVEYSNWGVWYLRDESNLFGISIKKSIGDLIK